MAVLQIPEPVQASLRLFQTIDQPVVEQLYAALTAEPPQIGPGQLIDSVSKEISGLSRSDISKIVSAILSLHSGLRTTKLSQEDFLQGIVDSEELAIPDGHKAEFRKRLKQSLDLPSLAITAKVNDVRGDHERTFTTARILTDLRPIFEYDNISSSIGKPAAAVINYMLKIEYLQGHELKEMFFALDNQDITDLRAVLRRADSKAVALKALVEKAGIPYLEAE